MIVSHVDRTINRYYEQFESYMWVAKKYLWLSSSFVFFGVMFFRFLILLVMDITKGLKPEDSILNITAMLVSELMMVTVLILIMGKRDRENIEQLQIDLNTKETRITKLKKLWLEKTIGVDKTKYIDLALEIENMNALRKRNTTTFSNDWVKMVLDFIYKEDSKGRVVAMFMGLCASIVILSISNGATIENIFIYMTVKLDTVFKLFAILIVIFLSIRLVMRMFFYIVLNVIFSFIAEIKQDNNVPGSIKTKIFINALLDSYELPKAKIKYEL